MKWSIYLQGKPQLTFSFFTLLLVVAATGLRATESITTGHYTSNQISPSATFSIQDNAVSGLEECYQSGASVFFGVDLEGADKVSLAAPLVIVANVKGYDFQQGSPFFNQNITFTIDPRTTTLGERGVGHLYKVPGAFKVSVQIVSVKSNGNTVACPGNVYLDLEVRTRKHASISLSSLSLAHQLLDLGASPQLISSNVNTAYAGADVMEVSWNAIAGAEYYELEWTYLNSYKSNTGTSGSHYAATDLLFDSESFHSNATRVSIEGLSYRIPLVYDKGFVVYRLRVVHHTDCSATRLEATNWTKSSCTGGNLSCFSPNYQRVDGHRVDMNWQASLMFAEEGKRKEAINYFDGSKRNRQSVVKNNTEQLAIVSEVLYDHQGRPAVNFLPAPGGEEVTYYDHFNRRNGQAYDRDNFDLDNGSACEVVVQELGFGAGSSNYYSDRNSDKSNHNAFIPDAQLYPFVQTEYEPDNTGRIRRQSGPGPDHILGSGHETQYFYGTPDQEELDRLFGTEVGYARHYKKEVVVDPNGQASISYKDMSGRVIATALTGDEPAAMNYLKNGNGAPLSTDVNSQLTVNILAQDAENDPDDEEDQNFINADRSGLETNYNLIYPKEDDLQLTYEITLPPFTDPCFGTGIAYEPVVNLEIQVFDPKCMSELYSYNGQVGTYNQGATADVVFDPGIQLLPDLAAGNYFIHKGWKIDEQVLDKYAEDYLSDNSCLSSYTDFLEQVDYTDCNGALSETFIGFEACKDALGDRQDYDPESDYDELLEQCREAYTGISICEEMYNALLADVSPGGQYAAYEEDANGDFFSNDPLSVFNDGSNQNNILPAVLDGSVTSIPLPTGASSLKAVIENWDATAADHYVQYHPEYKYYDEYFDDYCDQTITYDGITTQEYDWLLTRIVYHTDISEMNAYATAVSSSSPSFDPYTRSGSNFPILDQDPFFVNNATLKTDLFSRLNSYRKHPSKDIYEYAAYVARCGSWYGNNACPDNNAVFGSSSDASVRDREWNILKTIYLEQKYEMLYEKANEEALNILSEPSYRYCNTCIGVKDYNPINYLITRYTLIYAFSSAGYGGSWLPSGWIGAFNDFAFVLSRMETQTTCGFFSFFYKDKQKRFNYYDRYLPAPAPSEDDKDDVDYEIYKRTGLCPLTTELKGLLEDVGSNHDITANIELRYLQGLSPAIYKRISGFSNLNQAYARYEWTPSITLSGSRLNVDLNIVNTGTYASAQYDRPSFLVLDFESGSQFDWNSFGGPQEPQFGRVRKLVPNPSHDNGSMYGFSMEVEIIDANGSHLEVIKGRINGFDPADCGGTFQDVVHASDEANELEILLNTLLLEANFTANNVDLEIDPYEDLFIPSALYMSLSGLNLSPSAPYDWNQLSSTTYQINSPGSDVIFRIFFCSQPPGGFAGPNLYLRNLKAIDPQNPPGCTANGETPNFQAEAVTVDFGFQPPRETVTTIYGYMDLYNPTGGPGNAGEVVSVVNTGYVGSPQQSAPPAVDCSTLEDARQDLQAFLNACLPPTYKDVVYDYFTPGTYTLSDDLYNQLPPTNYFYPQQGPIYYAAHEVVFDPQAYFGIIYEGHGNITIEDIYIDPVTGEYALDITSDGAAYGTIDCNINMRFSSPSTTAEFSDVVGITNLQGRPGSFVDGVTNQFIAVAILASGQTEVVEGESCFEFGECISCVDTDPYIPTNCWSDYNDFISDVATPLSLSEYLSNFSATDYCEMGITCLAEYIDYLQAMDITSENSPYYITIGEFCNRDMGYYLDYYKTYMPTVLGGGTPQGFSAYLPTTYSGQFTHFRDFAINGVGAACVSQYPSYYASVTNPVDIVLFCSGVGYEFPCPKVTFTPFPEFDLTENGCSTYYYNVAVTNAKQAYKSYAEEVKSDFKQSFRNHLLSTSLETFKRDGAGTADYQFTLYYYDQVGNLVKTVAPKGVNMLPSSDFATVKSRRADKSQKVPSHDFVTYYSYNSLNQVVEQSSPDGGTTHFWYDDIGRLVLSQNDEQDNSDKYSYSCYDALGRLVESGVLTSTTTPGASELNDPSFPDNISLTRSEVTRTYYDEMTLTEAEAHYQRFDHDFTFENLRNRVGASAYYSSWTEGTTSPDAFDFASLYSYDAHGNVKTLVQDLRSQFTADFKRFKRIDYHYDLVSGNVTQVDYQAGMPDQFFHRYDYDADNRILMVQTSRDGELWAKDADYSYYKHGPLARTVLGPAQVQGMDYAYTLQGWLKSVNASTLDPTRDMGGDGTPGGAIPQDAFGFSLNYYNGDYSAISGSSANFLASTSNMGLANLYNGNISGMVTSIMNTVEQPLKTHGNKYTYDQLNRLSAMDVYKDPGSSDNVLTSNSFNGIAQSNDYQVRLTYDANGNIMSLKRNGYAASGSLTMDDLTYQYPNYTNRLERVTDAGPSGNSIYGDDIESQTNQYNYDYDDIGNLIEDKAEQIATINWTASGKIKDIIRTGTSSKPGLSFKYDASGNRVVKIVKPAGGSQSSWEYTYYVRDASGNIMAVYEGNNSQSQSIKEFNIYGSDRLGVCTVDELLTDPYVDECSGPSLLTLTAYSTYEFIGPCPGYGYSDPYLQAYGSSGLVYITAIDGGLTVETDDQFDVDPVLAEGESVLVDIGSSAYLRMDENHCLIRPLVEEMAVSFYGSYREYEPDFSQEAGEKAYELKNHLGNVLATVADYKFWKSETVNRSEFENYFDGEEEIEEWQLLNPVDAFIEEGALWVMPQDGGAGIARTVEVADNCDYSLCVNIPQVQGDMMLVVVHNGDPVVEEPLVEPMEICFELEGLATNDDLEILIFGEPGSLCVFDYITLNYSCTSDLLLADVLSAQDYYPGGMPLPGRVFSGSEKYRYGFNGMERDDEVKGDNNSLDFGARIYDPRIFRWLSRDPLWKKYPSYSGYLAFANNPINVIDPDGMELVKIVIKTNSSAIKGKLELVVDKEIAGKVKDLIAYAIENDIQVHFNSSFRSSAKQAKLTGNKYGGAKAGTSRHEGGFALDFNLYDKDGNIIRGNTSVTKNNEFISKAKALGFRWGGEFSTKDPIHIDAWPAGVDSKYGYSSWEDAYFENQNDTDIEVEEFEYNKGDATSLNLFPSSLFPQPSQDLIDFVEEMTTVPPLPTSTQDAPIYSDDFLLEQRNAENQPVNVPRKELKSVI